MKLTIGETEQFLRNASENYRKAKQMCFDLVNDNTEFPTHSIEWDYDEEDAPCISSCDFDDDITDAYIKRLYVEKGQLKVDLYACYIGEDRDGIELADECNVNYFDILGYINNKRS